MQMPASAVIAPFLRARFSCILTFSPNPCSGLHDVRIGQFMTGCDLTAIDVCAAGYQGIR